MTASEKAALDSPVKRKRGNCITKVQDWIVGTLELIFYKYGKSVASHPVLYILLCFVSLINL
jgi:hypothetical protein